MRHKKNKHHSFDISVHLFSVLVVFIIALLVGYSAKGSHTNFRQSLALALLGTDSTTTTLPEVTFSVTQNSSLVNCDTLLKPRTSVTFATSIPSSGLFTLSMNTTSGTSVLPGEYFLPNGTYHWVATVKAGYVGAGDLSGDLTLSGTCPIQTSTTTTSDQVTSPLVTNVATTTVSPSTILPTAWYNGSRVLLGETIAGEPVLRIAAPDAIHAGFGLSGNTFSSRMLTEQDGVTHILGTNIWSMDLSKIGLPNGAYKVVAFFETSTGKYSTGGIGFSINKTTAVSLTLPTVSIQTSAASALPVLKVFVDDTPVTDRGHAFSDGETELRVVLPPARAKRITLLAASSSVLELGKAVKDDLLSTDQNDVWSFVWDIGKVSAGQYKVFARVLFLDNHTSETLPILMNVVREEPEASQSDVSSNGPVTSETPASTTREAILSRVTTPALCTTKEDCQVYCASHPEENRQCTAFVRALLSREVVVVPSLVDGIDPRRLEIILNDQKRSKEIPEEVSTPEKLKDFCTELSHADVCAKVLVRNDLASNTTLEEKKTSLEEARNEEKRIFVERIGARAFVDSDMDGISDYDEVNIYHTDPNDPDTDHDGFPDGAEIVAHTNPLGGKESTTASTSDESVRMESPRITGPVSSLLAVEDVSLAPEKPSDASKTASSSELLFKGHSVPNSFVTLYIFSDPIVVTVKTDEFGAWTYTLDKALADGSHEVYSAITDSGGHILARSEPLPFVKEASAVSVGSAALLPANAEPGFFSGASLYAFIAIIIGILGIAFSIIGFVVRRRDMEDLPLDPMK